ncbi:MAG: GIY-YIG nuclease family protein [Gillisia sp.]
MIFIFVQYIQLGGKTKIPFRLLLYSEDFIEDYKTFTFRPELFIPKKIYAENNLDRLELLACEPFCNSADELIDLFRDQNLIFSEKEHFLLLKSQFKNIGYNFNLKPTILWSSGKKDNEKLQGIIEFVSQRESLKSAGFAKAFLKVMHNIKVHQNQQLESYKATEITPDRHKLSEYDRTPGVYFFFNAQGKIIYVGKAKNIRKRLQSHFINTAKHSNIDYSQVSTIDVIYTGNDIIAQLVESENIKNLQPHFNSQQVTNPDPFIITLDTTAKGISKIKITRKVFEDSLPEKYFNRKSVIDSLKDFCKEFNLCRKHCGLEKVKGPCSNNSKNPISCVCSGGESIEDYNKRFRNAFDVFREKSHKRIYKLKGRNRSEDAFVYEVNGIYEGYGYIEKSQNISNFNDILGYLVKQKNNYDTTRIISSMKNSVKEKDILLI